MGAATEEDWATEYHALTLAVGVVDGTEAAIEHINRFGSRPLRCDPHPRHRLPPGASSGSVDSACVYVNASTRFTDGGEFGMGAEIGNSTQKLHARGPIGLRELCTSKYLIEGDGHIRPLTPLRRRDMRLGILGGTFNPPHLGHLICAECGLRAARARPAADRADRASRPTSHAAGRIRARRSAWRSAARRSRATSGFEVSALEVERPGPSYTVDTLRTLHERAPDTELFFIVGGDAAASLPRWRDPEGVLELATLAIARRSGTSGSRLRAGLGTLRGGERCRMLRMPQIGISSTLVRNRVKAGRSIRYLVPQEVASLIATHGLYTGRLTA